MRDYVKEAAISKRIAEQKAKRSGHGREIGGVKTPRVTVKIDG